MTQQDDITQRLRDNADLDEAEHGNARVVQLERDAADEIERLRSLLSKLRAEGVQAGDERAAFEASYRSRFNVPAHAGLTFPDVAEAWEWWQARAALASAPVADERAAQEYGSPADLAQRIEQYLAQDGRMNSGTQLLYEAMKALRSLAGGSK